MPELAVSPGHEIARRLEIRGDRAWIALLKPAQDIELALEALEDELHAYLGGPARTLDASRLSVAELRDQVHTLPDDTVVLTGLDDFDEERWTALDINRDGLARRGALVLWLSPAGIQGLCRYAPNIRSFIGGSIFLLGPDAGIMTETEREARLADLATHYGLTSSQVIEMAEERKLPPDPEFAEWLVLLGRGDLL